jgi:hypothetical protein
VILRKFLKTIPIIAYGFTIAHGLLFFLLISNQMLYSQIVYHHSESLTWYVLFFFAPLLAGIAFFFWLRNKVLFRGSNIFFLACFLLQLSFTVFVCNCNYNYWGYAFRRPPVFNEVANAERILSCTKVSNTTPKTICSLFAAMDTISNLDKFYGREYPYEGASDRIFMTFQDHAGGNGNLHHLSEIYKDPKLKSTETTLEDLDLQIHQSNLIDKGEKGGDTSGQLHGFVTEFITAGKDTSAIAGLNGGQVFNDHYPYYEFLFAGSGGHYTLIKKQRFYTDVAGIEGMEYANLAPFFSLILAVLGALVFIPLAIADKLKKLPPQELAA